MAEPAYLEARGLGELVARLHAAFPASLQIDYLDVCKIKRSVILNQTEATQIRLLGGALTLLEEDGSLVGRFYDNGEFRYYWDCALTARGFNTIDGLLKSTAAPLSAATIISGFDALLD